ncbi:hypothetical protein K7432_011946, partial [Basidiobolus ranarum]
MANMEETPSQTNKISEYLRRTNSFRRSRIILLVGWLTPVSFLVSLAPLISSFHMGSADNFVIEPTELTLILGVAFIFHLMSYFAMLSRLLEWNLRCATRIACIGMFFDGVLHLMAVIVILVVYKLGNIVNTTDLVAAVTETGLA